MPRRPPGRRPLQGSVPDDAGAQQRGRVFVVEGIGDRIGIGLVDHGPLGEAAMVVPTGEAGFEAQVLGTVPTEPAPAAGGPQPGDPHPVADAES